MDITYYILNFIYKHMDIIQYTCNTFCLNYCTHFPWNSYTNNTNFALMYQTAVQSYCYQAYVHLRFVINGAHTLLGPDKVLYR